MSAQLEIDRKTVARLLERESGRKALGEALRLNIKAQEDLGDRPIVAVLVPSYKALTHKMQDTSTKMIRYAQRFCTVYTEPVRGSSVIHWTRNEMLANLYLSGKAFTHVLWMDDDMDMWDEEYLVRMLRHQVDVVGCLYTFRSDPPLPNVHVMDLATQEARRVMDFRKLPRGLYACKTPGWTLALGTGAMLVTKQVCDRVAEMYINCEYERALWNLTPEQMAPKIAVRKEICAKAKNAFWFKFLDRMTGFGENGEDTSFCVKAAMCGFRVHLDTSIQPGHVGDYSYSYRDFLGFADAEIAKFKAKGSYAEPDVLEMVKTEVPELVTA